MAEVAIRRLEDRLSCGICFETYTDPKLLQCFHTFCAKCLIKLVVRDQQGQLICPNCRQVTPVPPNGVTGLQSAFYINELLEIRDDLRKAKNPVASVERVEDGATSQTSMKEITYYCCEHNEEETELHCKTCKKLICWKCVKGGKHQSHDYDSLDEAFDKYKGEIIASLEPMEKQLKTVHTALAQLDTRSGEISDQRETTESSIHDTIKRIHEILDVRKTKLIGQLHHITQGKLKDLGTQRDHLETIQAQLSSCLDLVYKSLKKGSHAEFLNMMTTIVNRVKELTTPFQPDLLKPNTEADMTFSTSHNFTEVCMKYGEVLSHGSRDPSTGNGLEVAMKSASISQAGNSRGVDVFGSTTFIYRGEATSLTWKDHGFKLHLPHDALPFGVAECHIQVKAALSGQFQFPDDVELVSGVYCIHTSHSFTKPVTMEIQHCSVLDTLNETKQMCFAVNTGDQLPHIFNTREGGSFSTNNLYGSIEVKHFCKYSIVRNTKDSTTSFNSCKLYRAHLWYKENEQWSFFFSIIPDTDLHHQMLLEKQALNSATRLFHQPITFTEMEIKLSIPDAVTEVETGWFIFPSHAPVVRDNIIYIACVIRH